MKIVTILAIDSKETMGYTALYDVVTFDHEPTEAEVIEALKPRYGEIYDIYYEVSDQ